MPTTLPRVSRLRRVGLNTNMDGGAAAGFSANGGWLSTFYAQNPNFHGPREGRTGPFNPGIAQEGDTPNWTPFNGRLELEWFIATGGMLLYQMHTGRLNPYVAAPSSDAQVWSAAKLANVRYLCQKLRAQYPNYRGRRGIWGMLMVNEMDLNMDDVCALPTAAGERKNAAIARFVSMQKAWWEELNTHPAVVFSGTTSAQALKYTLTDGSFRVREWLSYNNGEVLNYMRVYATTWHHSQSNFLQPGFTSAGPANGDISLCWAWLAMKEARVLNPTAPKRPIACTEFGCSSKMGNYGTPPTSGDWITDDTGANGKQTIRAYRLGLAALAQFYWGVSYVNLYSLGYSGADLNTGGEPASSRGSGYGTQNFYWDAGSGSMQGYEPAAEAVRSCFDQRRYVLPADGGIPIVAKNWRYSSTNLADGFHRPYSWAVCTKLYVHPTGTSIASPPRDNWAKVTIGDGLITSAPGIEQVICRPVILPSWTSYRVTAEMICSGGGTANLCVRGYDYLDGLAFVRSTSNAGTSWTTLSVEFRPQSHGVKGLPNVPACVICAYHDGVGTMQIRNVRVETVGASSSEPEPTTCWASATDHFLNPFKGAFHRAIGSGAQFAGAGHQSTIDWRKDTSVAVNNSPGAGWGCVVSDGRSSYPLVNVTFRNDGQGGNAADFSPTPQIRIPSGWDTGPRTVSGTLTDRGAAVYNPTTDEWAEFWRLDYDDDVGLWRANNCKRRPGTGYGYEYGSDARGVTASGISILSGLIRLHEWTGDGVCEHALAIALEAHGAAAQLSPNIVYPATRKDSSGDTNEGTAIPYGALFAVPTLAYGGPNPAGLELGTPGSTAWRLYTVASERGIFVVDKSTGMSMRGENGVPDSLRTEISSAMGLLRTHFRMVLNVTAAQTCHGGGVPLAPYCGYDR